MLVINVLLWHLWLHVCTCISPLACCGQSQGVTHSCLLCLVQLTTSACETYSVHIGVSCSPLLSKHLLLLLLPLPFWVRTENQECNHCYSAAQFGNARFSEQVTSTSVMPCIQLSPMLEQSSAFTHVCTPAFRSSSSQSICNQPSSA